MKKKSLFTTHPSSDREKKNLLFLNLIRKHKSISRTEIAKLIDMNIVTVSNYVNGYLRKGLVLEGGYDISSGGRRPELVELNKDWAYGLGIDIGRRSIKGVLVDSGMEVLASESIPDYDIANLKLLINEIIKKLLENSKVDRTRVKKIGIGVSTVSNNIEEVVKIKDEIENEVKIPILVGDGALCAASGEKSLNPEATETSSILYVYKDLGQGVFIKDDDFYQAYDPESRSAYLRPWSQKLSIVNQVKKVIERGIATKIISQARDDLENITVETIIKAAEEKDEIATDLIRIVGMNLGVRIAYLINSLEPEIIIVGGGMEKAGNRFLEPLSLSINRFILQSKLDRLRLTPAVLGEEACVKGAASLAIREAFIEA